MKLKIVFSLLGLVFSALACSLVSAIPTGQPTQLGPVLPAPVPQVHVSPVEGLPASTAEAPDLPVDSASAPPPVSGNVIPPANLEYLGAFRLPGGDERPKTFAYGGNTMTFNPDGDPHGAADGFPGSLFVMGHDRMPYGDLPDGNQVAEISIPVPVASRNIGDLNTTAFLQDFQNVTAGYFTDLDEIPRVEMQYLNHPKTGPKIHLAWGQHLQTPGVASHAWFSPQLTAPDIQGNWLARVASGQMETWESQPYASIDIDEHLYLSPPESDLQNVGWGDQRRYRMGDVTFDRANGLLYVLELYADGAKPIVHVWRVRP